MLVVIKYGMKIAQQSVMLMRVLQQKAASASAEYYNPASIVLLKRPQLSLGGNLVVLSTVFKKGGQFGIEPTKTDIPGGTTNLVPNFHIAIPLTSKLYAAFGGVCSIWC